MSATTDAFVNLLAGTVRGSEVLARAPAVAASTGSACHDGAERPSAVLTRRVSETRSFLGKVWRLAAPYWWCSEVGIDRTVLGFHLRIPERWIARELLPGSHGVDSEEYFI